MLRLRPGRISPQVPAVMVVAALSLTGIIIWWKDSRGDPNHLAVSGTVEGESVQLGSKLGGRVSEIRVAEGDILKPGQVIARFDSPEIAAQRQGLLAARAEAEAFLSKLRAGPREVDLRQAQAGVDIARANYAEVAAGARDEDIAAAKAQWQAAEVQYDLAVADLSRTRKLFENGVVPRSQLDAAEARANAQRKVGDAAKEQYEKAKESPRGTQLDIAAAQVKSAQANYDLVRAGSRPEDIIAAEARLAGIDAELAHLDIRTAEATVSATGPGVLIDLLAQPGDLVQPNFPVAEMLLTGSYFVQVFIPEAKLSWAEPGTSAAVTVDSYPGHSFTGTVTYLATQGDFTPRNLQTKEKRVEEVYRCKIKLGDAEEMLRPGMVCDVVFEKPGHVNAKR